MIVNKRKFGSLNFDVSVIGFGGAAVSGEGGGYGFGTITESDSITLIAACADHGINLFDTAPIYGFGLSEQRIGKALKGKREEVCIVSKCGVDWDINKRVGISNEPKITEKMLHQSLKDLQTDYIDLYMIHWPDPKVDIRKTMEFLKIAKQAGKIRSIGLCNTNFDDYSKAQEIDRIDVLQSNFNLFDRTAIEQLWPSIDRDSLGFMSYGTFDKGILTGRATANRKYDATDLRSKSPQWTKQDKTKKFEAVEKLKKYCDDQRIDLTTIVLQAVLSHRQVSTGLCGIRCIEQMESAIVAANANVMPEQIQMAYEITTI